MDNALERIVPELKTVREYEHLKLHFDEQYAMVWCYMHSRPRPCFSAELLEELHHARYRFVREIDNSEGMDLRYVALASDVPGVFNLGGDLNLFMQLVQKQDRDGLLKYGRACIDIMYENMIHLDRGVTTIALVQGDALGGGFEAALSSNVLIAERSAKLGFPEILFNLFPGMGAYSLLSRKIGGKGAERLITSGKLYTAEELNEIGVIDVLAEDGQGERAVYDYIQRAEKAPDGFRAIRSVVDRCNTIEYDELFDIVQIWVDTAMKLRSKDLRLMERFVRRQGQKI